MLKEIEKKYRVGNLEEVENKLIALGAELKGVAQEQDVYFNVSGRDSMATKECLRIRNSPKKQEITYKPPTKINDSSTHFAKQETNLPIQDIDMARDFLICLGNSVLVELNKDRKYYSLKGTTVTLDLLNGKYSFVEIEVESNDETEALSRIEQVEHLLGLSGDLIETRPYRDIAMGIE